MLSFILAITTYNRLSYLKECLDSWNKTKSNDVNWIIVIADDGSHDGTVEYLDSLKFTNTEIITLKNKRLGVHQQMNTILKTIENIDFDFCYKIDDDITFLQPGWDKLYYTEAINTGNHHLVFCDETWCIEQFLKNKVINKNLIGRVPIMHSHGFFYTLTPQIIKEIGFMDVNSFGYRGMGHVDYTMRCSRAGYTNSITPWDLINSNDYISATKYNYKSVLPSSSVSVYGAHNRERKEKIILQEDRIFIPNSPIDYNLHSKFKDELIEALSAKLTVFESKESEIVDWYKIEKSKTETWYNDQYSHLPNWYLKIGKIFKYLKLTKKRFT